MMKHTDGVQLIQDPFLNKGNAFSEEERDVLGLRGLLPPSVFSMDLQVMRVLENFRAKPTDLEKYLYLISLQDENRTLFYRVVIDNIAEEAATISDISGRKRSRLSRTCMMLSLKQSVMPSKRQPSTFRLNS